MQTAGLDESRTHMPGVPGQPRMKDAIWNRPEGRGGPWAQKQAQGIYKDPQALHGRSGAPEGS